LSDGADTVATDESAARGRAVAALKASGARVDVIQFKTKDPDATSALKEFASLNGGSVVAAVDAKAVTSAFNESAKALASQVKFAIPDVADLSGTHELKLSGVAGATGFSFTRSVSFATGPTPTAVAAPAAPAQGVGAAAASLPPPRASTPWQLWLAVALSTLGAFGLLFALLSPSLETNRERRVANIESYVYAPKLASRSERRAPSAPFSEQLSDLGERFMKGRKSTAGTLTLIDRADLPFRAGDWFILSFVSVVVFGALGLFILSGLGLMGLVIGAFVGLAVPPLTLRRLASKRARNFEAVLPDVLMLVSTSLRSGFGLPQALDAVARDAAEPAAKEFSRALAETRIGTDVADALDRAADRMDSKALRWTVMAIRVQREVGGNLAETLVTTSATLRERESLFRQVRALSAEGRISAAILVALPIGLFFYMMAVNREYISLLWLRPIGLLMIAAGLILMAVGVFWMSRLVKIEV
jgi:tight adherence protein B